MWQRINLDVDRKLWRRVGIKSIQLDLQKRELVEKALLEFLKEKDEGGSSK